MPATAIGVGGFDGICLRAKPRHLGRVVPQAFFVTRQIQKIESAELCRLCGMRI